MNTGRGFAKQIGMFALPALLLATTATAENWPQWRGPSSHGISSEKNLPTTWSDSKNVAWKVPLAGLGTSSPIVWNDRI
ncbi:MAG TPA: pyrrolo-quinoline quinone, partial [Terriglobia bacterium]|nr:pyrrolo-quinoline quinone [Terriglobia bacterium]